MDKMFKTASEMINQIEFCKFEDKIGHPLENNVGYIELKELALKQEKAIETFLRAAKGGDLYILKLAYQEFKSDLNA